MQLSDAAPSAGAGPPLGAESCRFPKLEECAHFHYERVQLPRLEVTLQADMDRSLHSQHTVSSLDGSTTDPNDYFTLQVTCRDECWLIQRTLDNFKMLDAQLHQCIYDRKVSQLRDLSDVQKNEGVFGISGRVSKEDIGGVFQADGDLGTILNTYLDRLCSIIDNSLNCGPILNWFQLDNRGHRLLVPSEESRSINTPAVAAAYSVRKYVSQARDELSLEVGDMISVIDMASPGESVWWRGKRGFQVGFFPQHCVHIIGDKVPRNMPLPPPVVGSLAISPIKPVLRKHGKLITFFRSFILNRPSRRRLKQSGILKERVFGCDLGEHLLNSGHEIPMVLKCCAEFIESHGIVDGIYRLSGVTSNIQKLRNAFDEDRIPNLYTDDILKDIHSVASLLKMYFRELPNPLCTYQLYHSFVSAVQGCLASRNKANDNERLLKMREAVQKLPPPHYRTLEYLMRHLARIAAHGSRTGMTTRNVAIVWAPNLLRCEELEIGGVAALQGVGVQAVVTEFLVCYAHLIFSDRPPPLLETETTNRLTSSESDNMSPKRSRPKSLAISTPTKLLTLEEARNKHLLNKPDDGNYIEVGGGPNSLPKKYHTVIELPAGSRKRGLAKRSPSSGWRSFFSKSRNSSHGNLSKREISSPGITTIDKSVTESDLNEIKRKLRPVKSAESLTSGQSEPGLGDLDVLGPLHCLSKPTGHNRSVSHDSYFDNLQSSTNNSVGSLLDLSEIQLNFELEESEMRIFSEDESLVSSPKVQKEAASRKPLYRARPEEFSSATNSSNPSPKKQPRVVLSPDSMSRKRSRLEDQLSDIQYIDCNTPENPCVISTTALVHSEDRPSSTERVFIGYEAFDGYQPKNKSPRNSDGSNRYSLNFEKIDSVSSLPKSRTEMDFKMQSSNYNSNFTPTPQTPNYKPLDSTSTTNTPILSPTLSQSPHNLSSDNGIIDLNCYQNVPTRQNHHKNDKDHLYQNYNKRYSANFECKPNSVINTPEQVYENVNITQNNPNSPTYENVLTTINITYKSPTKSRTNSENIYEDIELMKPEEQAEKAVVPTTVATLPVQEAMQPLVDNIATVSTSESSAMSLPTTPTDISPKVSLETTFDVSITTIASDTISADSGTLKEELLSNSSDDKEEENIVLNFVESSEEGRPVFDQEKSVDSTTEPTNKSVEFSTTYKSIDSISSMSGVDNTSRKSLISPNDEQSGSDAPLTSSSSSLRSSKSSMSPSNITNCTSQLNQLEINDISSFSQKSDDIESVSSELISNADQQTLNETSSRNSSSLNISNCQTQVTSLASVDPICDSFGSTDQLSTSLGNNLNLSNKSGTITTDKRKSCDAELLDENTIYQQVKYFRRSIHEINSLLDLPLEDGSCLNKSKSKSMNKSLDKLPSSVDSIHDRTALELENACADLDRQHPLLNYATTESVEHFDSLEAENVHLYENVKLRHGSLKDDSRVRMHENEPKTLSLTSDVVQDLPVCTKCSTEPDSNEAIKKNNVKNLTSKFEAKEVNAVVEKCRKFSVGSETELASLPNMNLPETEVKLATQQNKNVKHHDKDNLPPCLRAKNAKNSIKTRSLDENSLSPDFSRTNSPNLQRRKSLDDRTSSYIDSKLLVDSSTKLSSVSTFDIRHENKNARPAVDNDNSGEQKLNRERIEKYKEERRNFWREKYRSESFKEDKDKLLSRLKSKSFKSSLNTEENELQTPVKEQQSVRKYNKPSVDSIVTATENVTTTVEYKPTKTKELTSKFELKQTQLPQPLSHQDGAVHKLSFRNKSPLMDRKNRPSLKELSDKLMDESLDETSLKGPKEEEFLRYRRGDGESERKRHTYDNVRERECEVERERRVSLESKSTRKEKCSPSYCIKDMKAIFESKSQQ